MNGSSALLSSVALPSGCSDSFHVFGETHQRIVHHPLEVLTINMDETKGNIEFKVNSCDVGQDICVYANHDFGDIAKIHICVIDGLYEDEGLKSLILEYDIETITSENIPSQSHHVTVNSMNNLFLPENHIKDPTRVRLKAYKHQTSRGTCILFPISIGISTSVSITFIPKKIPLDKLPLDLEMVCLKYMKYLPTSHASYKACMIPNFRELKSRTITTVGTGSLNALDLSYRGDDVLNQINLDRSSSTLTPNLTTLNFKDLYKHTKSASLQLPTLYIKKSDLEFVESIEVVLSEHVDLVLSEHVDLVLHPLWLLTHASTTFVKLPIQPFLLMLDYTSLRIQMKPTATTGHPCSVYYTMTDIPDVCPDMRNEPINMRLNTCQSVHSLKLGIDCAHFHYNGTVGKTIMISLGHLSRNHVCKWWIVPKINGQIVKRDHEPLIQTMSLQFNGQYNMYDKEFVFTDVIPMLHHVKPPECLVYQLTCQETPDYLPQRPFTLPFNTIEPSVSTIFADRVDDISLQIIWSDSFFKRMIDENITVSLHIFAESLSVNISDNVCFSTLNGEVQ